MKKFLFLTGPHAVGKSYTISELSKDIDIIIFDTGPTMRKIHSQKSPNKKILEWVEEENAFYFCMQWGEGIYWRKAKRIDRKWAKKFCYKIKSYLEDEYENAQYTKTVERDYYETWIKFVEK